MKTYYYHLYGCVLKSEIPYEQLVRFEGEKALTPEQEDKAIVLGLGGIAEDVLEQYQSGKMLKIKKDFIWFSNEYGIFQIARGKDIRLQPHESVSVKNLTSFVFGYCIAMLFWQRGLVAIHCSAVSMNGKALLIAGGSGAGKSTLTQCFLSHGAELMCDDVAIVESDGKKVQVYPAFPMQKEEPAWSSLKRASIPITSIISSPREATAPATFTPPPSPALI